MSKPIAPAKGIAFAFPNVCNTPAPPSGQIPIPYPNIAQLSQAEEEGVTGKDGLIVGSDEAVVLLEDAIVEQSTGDEAGTGGGINNGGVSGGKCRIIGASKSVVYGPDNGKGIVRFMDPTQQNDGNAAGYVMSAFPTVLVGD